MAVKVTLFSDYTCPFCFAGLLRMERLSREVPLELDWRGVELHPDRPDTGEPTSPGLRHRLLDPGGAVQHFLAEEGVEVQAPLQVVNSRLALEATEYAREHARAAEFHRAVFEAYWIHGEDIGKADVLAGVARDIGLDPAGLLEYLRLGFGRPRLQAHRDEAAAREVYAMPTFFFDDSIRLEGVQAYDVFRRVALRLAGHP